MKYGDPTEMSRKYTIKSLTNTDARAVIFFAGHTLADGRKLPPDVQREYVLNASLLNAMGNMINERTAKRKALGGNTRNIWKGIALELESVRVEMGHTLPENHRSLQRKFVDYKSNGYIALVSGKWLNNNSKIVKDVQQEAIVRQLLRKHNNLDNEQIKDLYNIVAENCGWKQITKAATIGNYREKWQLDTFSGRKGVNAFDNNIAMTVKRSLPVFPLYYLTMDGWDAELLYQKTSVNDKGHNVTTYHNRATIVVVLDPSVKYPLGYAIGTHETPELIKEALRNAILHTKELFGNMYKPLQLQTDRYGKGGLTPFYEACTKHYTPARAHNAKAKIIEPWFNYFNKKYCQLMPNWSGFGVLSRKEKQPNAEYLNKIHNSFPDFNGVVFQLERMIAAERASLIEKYTSLFREMPADDKLLMRRDDFYLYLGETKKDTNRFNHSGMVLTIDGVKREYDCFDPDFRRYTHIDWTTKYMPGKYDTVLAVSPDGSLRFELTEKYVQPMALKERQEGDALQLQNVKGFNKQIKEAITEGMASDYKEMMDVFNNNPQLNGTTAKLLLVDSNGQHKDQRNASKQLQAAQKVLKKQETKQLKAVEKDWKQEQDAYLDSKLDFDKYAD